MKKQVLFIHGAGEGAYKEDEKLAESLRQSLGASWEVHYPEMENEIDAPYETWARQIKEELAGANDPIVLIGHSVGGSILIKFVMETKIKRPVAGIFLIAAPFWGGDGGWTYDGYEELVLPGPADTRLPENVPVFLYHSKDDETVPFGHLALYARRLQGATIRELDGRGHQLGNNLSEVAHDIKKLLW